LNITSLGSTRPVARDMLSIEGWVALGFIGLWITGLAVGLPINYPDASNVALLQAHFVGPLAVAASLQLVLTTLLCRLGRPYRQDADPLLMLKLFPLVVLSVFLYFNFKAWTPLVNPRVYDAQLERIDTFGAPVVAALLGARQAIAALVAMNVDSWYNLLYFAMFFLSLAVHGVLDTPQRQRQLVLGMCLNLLVGGLAYWIAPAEGPFLYREGLNHDAYAAQQTMHVLFQYVQAKYILPPGYFTAALGAMPSLHIAQAVFFTLCAARSARPLLVVYIPVLIWITIEASASGWHYLIDLPAGVLLAWFSYTLATGLIAMSRSSAAVTTRSRPLSVGAAAPDYPRTGP
jgi:hypothetical protein